MKEPQETAKLNDFSKLDKDHRTFVELMVNENLTNKELADSVHRKRESTMSEWKRTDWYKKAREAYIEIAVKGEYKVKALQTILDLLDAHSEMVKLQAATTLLKMSGMLNDNDSPELVQAKIRKANADAVIAERKAEQMSTGDDSGLTINFVRTNREESDDGEATERQR